ASAATALANSRWPSAPRSTSALSTAHARYTVLDASCARTTANTPSARNRAAARRISGSSMARPRRRHCRPQAAAPAARAGSGVRSRSCLQPHAATATLADRALFDEFDARVVQRRDQLDQGIDVAAHGAFARFHALDGRQRQAGGLGEGPLIHAEQSAGGLDLCGGDQV